MVGLAITAIIVLFMGSYVLQGQRKPERSVDKVVVAEAAALVRCYSIMVSIDSTNYASARKQLNLWMDGAAIAIASLDPERKATNGWNMMRKIAHYRDKHPSPDTPEDVREVFESAK